MTDICTIREAVAMAKSDGIPVSEYALRAWIHAGRFPVRKIGSKALLSYGALVSFVSCDGCAGDNQRPAQEFGGIRRIEA